MAIAADLLGDSESGALTKPAGTSSANRKNKISLACPPRNATAAAMQPLIATCGARLRSPRLLGSATAARRSNASAFAFAYALTHHKTQRRCASDASRRPLRMAVIGSGPAGFYTAYRVMAKTAARVDMYEALPVPFGLVRFGVAPDHPEVKNCQEKFEEVAQSPDFCFVGNMAVGDASSNRAAHNPHGGHVPLAALARHYDAVVFAYGASRDRKLGVPGEDLGGVYAARDFVGWYNGLPGSGGDSSRIVADLARADSDTAVVIGQGNVALDVARMLLEHVDVLRKTDMSEEALEALSRSHVTRVHVVGRRGPMQAAFTIKEVRELMKLPGVGLHGFDQATLLPPKLKDLPRAQRRLMEVVVKGSMTPLKEARKSWSLDFCLAPKQFSASDAAGDRVATATFEKTRLTDPFDSNAQVEHTGELVDVPAQLVFRSIGYRSKALADFDDLGIPFDDRRGLILNDGLGRVLRDVRSPDASMTTQPYPGFYCAGWVKRGPTGVIASTMEDAFTTADAIVGDWQSQAHFLAGSEEARAGWDGVRAEVDTAGAKVVSWADWQKIDRVEMDRGQQLGKPRSKFTRTEDMLAVLG
ncbi:NADPH-adrenodoxin reductase [Sporothrix curviconia]|uniref:adrenodoxin-NADP(+) reductase n=1 Tax=Sporothrix curviconia TaxID=1260050 RepID=A0ABP0BRS9_9PEZI